jgi:nucleolar complex protein 2
VELFRGRDAFFWQLTRLLFNATHHSGYEPNPARMPVSKSTKKFEKNKLGDVLKRRKANAKVVQKQHLATKRKERKAKDNAPAADLDGNASTKPNTKDAQDTSIGEMSMDQFFQGGFQLPELNKKGATKQKTGKRKRTPVQEKKSSESSSEEEAGSEGDSGDDIEAHKEQLAALADKDPEFYKYLKDNDAELLDFAEDADLAEIDALSASEDEQTPRKKQKASKQAQAEGEDGADNEVTTKLVEKWRSSMEKASSLRAMREIVLAFRSAAHLNEDTGKQYKYTISEPDGMLTHKL